MKTNFNRWIVVNPGNLQDLDPKVEPRYNLGFRLKNGHASLVEMLRLLSEEAVLTLRIFSKLLSSLHGSSRPSRPRLRFSDMPLSDKGLAASVSVFWRLGELQPSCDAPRVET